jgi:nucleoside-diphosphate-sugar epimerase
VRIVVLGGTRFIGLAIVEELLAHGHDVTVVHRGRSEPDELAAITHVHADRMELPPLDGFDACVDTSAMTRAHAEAAVRALAAVPRAVVLSSMDVYRAFGSLHDGVETDPVPLTESSPVREKRYPYRGATEGMDDYEKLDVEETYLARSGTVLRLPMVHGERDGQRREEPVLRRVRAGRDRIPVGPGTWLTCRGYVRDIASGVRLAVERDSKGEIFNLCESPTFTVAGWMRAILGIAGSDAELVPVPEDVVPDDLGLTKTIRQHILTDASKAKTALGWTHGDPDDTLRASVEWHLEHPPENASEDFAPDDAALAGL